MLSHQVTDASLKKLVNQYRNSAPIQPHQENLFNAINQLAAKNDIRLSEQSENVIKLLFSRVKATANNVDMAAASQAIYNQLEKEWNVNERQRNLASHKAQGQFDIKPLHLRGLKDQMQDHDMTQIMPKSTPHIEVLAVFNPKDKSTTPAMTGAISTAMSDSQIKHIVIPIGPGHWRGIYLTKPAGDSTKYGLELFDPYGPAGAARIKDDTINLLKQCGINEDQLNITYTGPNHPQNDYYACGDFTCAHTHKKMQEFGAKNSEYNPVLIETLDTSGNRDDSLRNMTRQIAEAKTLTPKEMGIFNDTAGAKPNTSSLYKEELAQLLLSRNKILDTVEKAKGKTQLTDEEYAATLQAEEFEKVGLGKPR